MGGHHKKNLRAEKAKVKLKGAKLPKGLNITKTDFKVRKIEIRTQLKDSFLSANNGQRQLNLKEALYRLKHHNLKFRTDALRNVRNAVKAGEAGNLIGHLSELLQGVAAGALDIEQEVRRESFKTLDVLLEVLPVEAMVPFFHIIAAYLRCAMTHVQPSIQEDSLLLLDVLLQRVPSRLLAERSASTIISNFIDMISRTRHDTQHTNRLLTVRLGHGHQTTIKWRTKVLLRLQQILGTLLQQNSQGDSIALTLTRVVHYDATKVQHYNVLRPQLLDTQDLCSILGERERKAENEQLLGFVEQLMPLLHDNWIEVRPQQHQLTQLLNADAAASLLVLLDIMAQLWQLVYQYETTQQDSTHELSDWMRRTYAANFVRIFLKDSHYPYQQMPLAVNAKELGTKKLKTLAAGGELCIHQNLTLILLVCHFWPQPTEEQRDDYGCLVHYINQCLRHLTTLTTSDQLRLVVALRALLLDNGAALLELHAHRMGGVMQNCIDAYVDQQYTTREGVATKVLNLLCQIVQRVELYQGYGGKDQFEKFLSYLPQLLLKSSVVNVTLTAMSTLCRQQNIVFMTALVESASKVLGNIERLVVTGDTITEQSRFENQKRILNLFYHARNCGDVKQLQAAIKHFEKNSTESIASYLQSIFSYE